MREKMNRAAAAVRGGLSGIALNVSLFVFAAFLFSGVLGMTPLKWYQDQVTQFFRFVLVPWGMALALARLMKSRSAPASADTGVLFALLVWMTVPYIYRFGLTFNNINAACGYAMVFFGVYALLREESPERRERLLDWACAVFGLFSLVFGGALLYCVVTAQCFATDLGEIGFGVVNRLYLSSGVHYNITGMIGVCCMMLCLCGAERARRLWLRLPYILGAVMMMVVIVLTQSRTARYSMLLVLALGVFCRLIGCLRAKPWQRAIAGLVAAAVVLVGGNFIAGRLNNAVLNYYVRVDTQRIMRTALEQGGSMDEAAVQAEKVQDDQAIRREMRQSAESTVSRRTEIWGALIKSWRENPKSLLIGNGVGNTGRLLTREGWFKNLSGIAVHNTYLQFIADYGLVGFGLQMLFFLLILRRCVLALLRAGREWRGMLPLAMLVLAILATGMMESAPLGEMTPMNVCLFFALGMLVPYGEQAQGGLSCGARL